jgi:hypothetical protein
LFGLTILVSGGLFLIAAGYSEDQMSPVIGLLGTIAGFVLGKDIQSNDASLPAAPVDVTPAKADI